MPEHSNANTGLSRISFGVVSLMAHKNLKRDQTISSCVTKVGIFLLPSGNTPCRRNKSAKLTTSLQRQSVVSRDIVVTKKY